MSHKFKVATAAGTFDHFHDGHESFLQAAFETADTIYIAITSDAFAKAARKVHHVAFFSDRKKKVEEFLKNNKLLERSKIFELHDVYGPTLEPDCPIQAIVVTEKTKNGADEINSKRREKELPALEVIVVPYVKAADGGEFSSTRIRNGQIDRQGNLYIKPEWLQRNLQLTDELRPMLQKPIGELIRGSEENLHEATDIIKQRVHPWGVRSGPTGLHHPRGEQLVVTVGDIVAQSFIAAGIAMDIAIVDFQVKREEKFKNLAEIGFNKQEPDVTVENPKGTLTPDLFKAVKNAFNIVRKYSSSEEQSDESRSSRIARTIKPYVIRVIGEEDLATLAVILAVPLGAHVYYGQPLEGIVYVEVTEAKKAEIRDIVGRFA